MMKKPELLGTQGRIVEETRSVYGRVLAFLNYNPDREFLNGIAEFIINTTESITGVEFTGRRALWFDDFHYMIIESYLGMGRSSIDLLNDKEQEYCFTQAFEIHQDAIGSSHSFHEVAALLEYQLLDLYNPSPKRTSVIEHTARVITTIIVHHVKRIVEGFHEDGLLVEAVNWKHGHQTSTTEHLQHPILGFFHQNSLWHFRLETLLFMPTDMLSLYFRNSKVSEIRELLKRLSSDSSKGEVAMFEQTLDHMRNLLKEHMHVQDGNDAIHWVYNSLMTAVVCLEKKSVRPDADKRAFRHLMNSEILKNLYTKNVPWYKRLTHKSRMRNMRQLLTAYLFESIIVAQGYHIDLLETSWNPYFVKVYEDMDNHPSEFPSDSLTPAQVELKLETVQQVEENNTTRELEEAGHSKLVQVDETGFERAVEELESLKKIITSYQLDFSKAINYPAFNDITVPEVTTMHKQLSKTNNLLNKVSNSKNEKIVHEFIEAVDVLAIDIKVAKRRAEQLSLNEYSEQEQKDFILAENLFRQAKDEGNTPKMRQNLYVKLQEVLERLNQTTEVIPHKIIHEIEETARKQLSS